ncbi:MAG TPA: hypothetical protein VK625_05175 [Flavitalea sp.]|nr:hypothetical protein [Flavitalea sp.]
MKNLTLAFLFAQIFLISCSKKSDLSGLISETATISSTKFSCGPTCTAEAWLLVVDNNISYEPVNLPDAYKISNLTVRVTLKKTGLISNNWQGTGEEQVEVIDIIKK